MRLVAIHVTGAPSVAIAGGFTTIALSLATVGVKSSPVFPGVVGGVGVLGRTLLPPPPQAAKASAIAQGRKARASRRSRRIESCLEIMVVPAGAPPASRRPHAP